MSGGSWDYFTFKLNDVTNALKENTTLRSRDEGWLLELTEEQKAARAKLAALLVKVSDALYAIEWCDSGDCSTPFDVDAIDKVFK